jgi:hypothetical protein
MAKNSTSTNEARRSPKAYEDARFGWRQWVLAGAAILALLLAADPVFAQNAASTDSPSDSSVRVSVTPYTWLSGISGKTGSGAATGDLNLKFGDILDDLHFSAMTTVRADFGRWHVATDLMYTSLGQDTGPTGPTNAGASVHTQSWTATVAAGYRLIQKDSWNLEVFAGLRGWDEQNLAIISLPRIGSRDVNFNQAWVDPIMGLRTSYRVIPKLDLVGAFDVGGFSVGSKFTAQVTGFARWTFTKSISGFVGYRYLYVDYDKNGFLYDISMHGPMLGATFQF